MYEDAVRTENRSRTNMNNSQLRTRNRDSIFDSELDYSGSAQRTKVRSYLSEMVDPCKTVEADGTRYLNVEAPKTARVAQTRTAEMPAVKERATTASIPRVKAATREEATRLRNAKASFPIATITLTIICTLLAMIMVYSFTQKHEATADLAALQATVAQLSAENKELSLALEEKDNLTLIEQLARNEYGMVGEEELPKRYLSLSTSDYVRSLEAETSNPGVFATILSAIGINFGNLGEYGQ
ncbi:MAG: septum formation initiator family protein [Clostridia bacterium]|nr:septum formation initiator family protein [Clostridia bacterium]